MIGPEYQPVFGILCFIIPKAAAKRNAVKAAPPLRQRRRGGSLHASGPALTSSGADLPPQPAAMAQGPPPTLPQALARVV
ncbi:MAG: hypothetical protein RBT72_01640 [Spirochaetia bacterium]|nr:hypothetical protein [Spirochaetia bacterium]